MMERLQKNKKESIQFFASLLMLLAGVALVFISLFLQPVGIIHYTVISVFGMFLTFVGAVWQVDIKYEFKTRELSRHFERGDYRPDRHLSEGEERMDGCP